MVVPGTASLVKGKKERALLIPDLDHILWGSPLAYLEVCRPWGHFTTDSCYPLFIVLNNGDRCLCVRPFNPYSAQIVPEEKMKYA